MIKEFPNGLTVKELKELLKDWPEQDKNGEDYTVWVETGENLSTEVKYVTRLNEADILFEV